MSSVTGHGSWVRHLLRLGSCMAVMSITGCHTIFYAAGDKAVTLSETVVTGFEHYKLRPNPLVFAVSTDGLSYAAISDHDKQDPIVMCEERAKKRGRNCQVFARGRTIVWNGPITYPSNLGENEYRMAITVKVEGQPFTTTNRGLFRLREDAREASLAMRRKGTDCSGTAVIDSGAWNIACDDGYDMAGSLSPGTQRLYAGTGEDSEGRKIELTVFAKSN